MKMLFKYVKLVRGHYYKLGGPDNKTIYKLIKATDKGYKFLSTRTNSCGKQKLMYSSKLSKHTQNFETWFFLPESFYIIEMEFPKDEPIKPPIDYVEKYNRFHCDGDGGPLDDYGTGIGGQPMSEKEKRYCKGCHADVTKSMYCHCGDFGLLKSETLSEEELKKLQ